MENTIIVEVLKWLGVTVAGNIVSKSSEATFTKIKKTFSKVFSEKFGTEEKSEEFIEKIYKNQPNYPEKPKRDIEDIFENITGNEPSIEILGEIMDWIKTNREILIEVMNIEEVQSGIKIGSQKANRDIINIQGNLTINNN